MEPVLPFMTTLAIYNVNTDMSAATRWAYRSTSTGSCMEAFNLKTRALPASLSCERMTIAPSVCLLGKLERLLSITSCRARQRNQLRCIQHGKSCGEHSR